MTFKDVQFNKTIMRCPICNNEDIGIDEFKNIGHCPKCQLSWEVFRDKTRLFY